MDFPLPDYPRNPFVVRYVDGHCDSAQGRRIPSTKVLESKKNGAVREAVKPPHPAGIRAAALVGLTDYA